MASGSNRAKINFIQMKPEELSPKVALLVSNNQRVIFWKLSPRYYEGKASHFEFNNKIYLTLKECTIHLRLSNERVCLNFTINGIDYFLRGKVVEQTDENLRIVIELEENCFRVENRNKERLQAYPIHEIYAYLKYKKQASSENIVFFNKSEQKNHNFFTEIDNIQKNKLAKISDQLKYEDSEDLIGFRVEDISSSGLSFFVNQNEKELILDSIGDQAFILVLNFGMQVFHLEDAHVVYKINYINSQFAGMPMFKVGVTFRTSPSLKKKIEEISGLDIDLADYQKEFEEFIKNEI